MDPLLAGLLALPNGARFYRVDLHNHTPRDPAFHCGHYTVDTDEQKYSFARAYVHFLQNQQGIEVVGITEHNDVSWLPHIQQAAEEIGLVVLPGVELSARSGKRSVHLLALFDPATPADTIDHFISSLGLVPDARFHQDGTPRLVRMDVEELTKQIIETRGIPIAAHASSKNGLFQDLGGESRVLAYGDPNLLAVEIPGRREELSEFERSLVNGECHTYGNKAVACLNHSDGRGLDEVPQGHPAIGSRFTNIKLGSPSVGALRQAFIDFDSRIRLKGERQQEHYPWLLGVIIERGFLISRQEEEIGPFTLHFNPNLNTLIGGRGTGKSALLEAIRYCFDLEPRTRATREQARQIVDATLPPGSRVTVFYELADGSRYRITRLKGHDPEIWDIASGEQRQVHPRQILAYSEPVEVYGQKEIYEISNDVAFQLNLLDTYVMEEMREIQRQESDMLRWLESNGSTILSLQDKIADAEQRIQELEAVRLELERMERHQAATRLEHKKRADREKVLLTQAEQAVDEALEQVRTWRSDWEPLRECLPTDIGREELPHTKLLEAQADLLARIDQESDQTLKALAGRIEQIWSEGVTERAAWEQDYAETEQEYQQLLDTLGQDFSAERYFALQTKLQNLEKIEKEIEKRQDRLQKIQDEREQKLRQLRRLRRLRQFRLRRSKATELTAQLHDTVRVAVSFEGNREAYAAYLKELFAGRRITQPVIEQLVQARLPTLPGRSRTASLYANPMHLAQAIRCERHSSDNESILAQVYDISAAYRARLAAIDDDVLYKLETYRVPDRPEISLKVGSEYRPLKPPAGQPGLSTGQKCTVILSLILVERHAPLIIDQPEDDLDNEFVYREVVQTLRREKERRQFIVATHNANIPVAGDAELIIALQADEDHGWIEHLGSIDDPDMRKPVEDILEGGKEAFEVRQRKYQRLE